MRNQDAPFEVMASFNIEVPRKQLTYMLKDKTVRLDIEKTKVKNL